MLKTINPQELNNPYYTYSNLSRMQEIFKSGKSNEQKELEKQNQTALIATIEGGNMQEIKRLVANGASLTEPDATEKRPLQVALNKVDIEAIEYIKSKLTNDDYVRELEKIGNANEALVNIKKARPTIIEKNKTQLKYCDYGEWFLKNDNKPWKKMYDKFCLDKENELIEIDNFMQTSPKVTLSEWSTPDWNRRKRILPSRFNNANWIDRIDEQENAQSSDIKGIGIKPDYRQMQPISNNFRTSPNTQRRDVSQSNYLFNLDGLFNLKVKSQNPEAKDWGNEFIAECENSTETYKQKIDNSDIIAEKKDTSRIPSKGVLIFPSYSTHNLAVEKINKTLNPLIKYLEIIAKNQCDDSDEIRSLNCNLLK